MKRLGWLLLMVAFLPTSLQAQVIVNNQDINGKPDVQYIELIVDSRLLGKGEVFAVIDYGHIMQSWSTRQHRMKDLHGKDRLFGSEMDIFNFLYNNGWLHETTYAVGKEGYIHHIFRRRRDPSAARD